MVTILFIPIYLLESRPNDRKDKKKRNEWHNKRMTARRALANPIPAAHAAECANERETTATARMIIVLS